MMAIFGGGLRMTKPKSPIEELVDLLFADLKGHPPGQCTDPVHGGHFMLGDDPIATQKREAVKALRLREWFAANSPADAPRLPISHDEIEEYRLARGLAGIVGWYARSLLSWDHDVNDHPSLHDYACGLMATDTGRWQIEKDEYLRRRFPPRELAGLDESARYTLPPNKNARRAA
jgi:hypothetical protein